MYLTETPLRWQVRHLCSVLEIAESAVFHFFCGDVCDQLKLVFTDVIIRKADGAPRLVQNADNLSIPSSAISLSVLPSVSMSNMLSMRF